MAESSPPDQTERQRAVDPGRSIIAQAPAGSGKTTLLVSRYLALLAVVNRPEEILAITFTRKAAGEMRARVIDNLREASDPAAREVLERSERLGWGLPEQSGRLRIQTIDSFAASLVRVLPVASGFAPGSRLEEDPASLYRRAVHRVFARIGSDDPLADDIADVLAYAGNDFESASHSICAMLGKRDQWLEPLVSAFIRRRAADTASLERVLSSGLERLVEGVLADAASSLTTTQTSELAALSAYAADQLGQDWPWRELPDDLGGWRFIAGWLTTSKGQLRRRLTRKDGFPSDHPTAQGYKRRALELLDELRDQQLDELLALPTRLPDPEVSRGLIGVLRSMATALTIATIELDGLFEARGTIDFNELTLAARRALGTPEAPTDLALALDYRIQHLLVDEFQDTSLGQFQLIEQLVAGWQPDDGRTFFAVGDPMQSIYRFRDADVALFLKVARYGIGMVRPEILRLSSNFRATANLVAWTNQVFAPAFGRAEDPVLGRVGYATARAARGPGDSPPVTLAVFGESDDAAEARHLTAQIARLRQTDGDASIAILVRSRTHLDAILPALSEAGLAWQGTDIDLLADEPVVRDLLTLLRALLDPSDRPHWLGVLRSPCVGLSLADLLELADRPGPLWRAVSEFESASLSGDARARLERIAPVLGDALAERGQVPVRRWLENTWLRLGGADSYPEPRALGSATRFLDLLEDRFPRTVELDELTECVSMLYAADRPAPDPAGLEAGSAANAVIQIMTIHKAKGLEFDHVLLPGLGKPVAQAKADLLSWRAEGDALLMAPAGTALHDWLRFEDRQRDRNEQLRLLYVACTRARQTLHLYCASRSVGDQIQPPARNSLLAPIWQSVAADATLHLPETTRELLPRPDRPKLRRVPVDYRWQAPADYPDLVIQELVMSDTEPRVGSQSQRFEIAVGTVIHRMLFTLSQGPLPDRSEAHLDQAAPGWRVQLAEQGAAMTDLDRAVEEVRSHIAATLADPAGRWLLSAQDNAASEAAYTGIVEGRLTQVVIDRTFSDESGQRWVIDYKSSRLKPGQQEADFIVDQKRDHAAQLRRYRRMLGGSDPQSVRAALYFTHLPRLVELDERDLGTAQPP